MRTGLIVLGSLLAAAPWAGAQPTLRVGDAAPALEPDHWLRAGEAPEAWLAGGPIADWSGGVTVVELWASWCGPCIAGFDDLSALQREFVGDGVRVVAVSNEPAPTCVEFMLRPAGEGRRQGDRMGFAVAADPDQSAWETYLLASGRAAIPRAFLIGPDGVIEWIGTPKADGLRDAVRGVLAGTWDRAAYRARFERAEGRQRGFDAALEAGDWDGAESQAGDDWERLNRLAFAILLSDEGRRDPLLARAERLLDRAMERSGGEQAFGYHARALSRAHRGDFADAVRLQERAIELDDGRGAAWYTQALEQYRRRLTEE